MTFDQLLLTGSFSDAGFDYNFASESINMGLVQANIRAPYSRIMDACNSSYWNVTSKYIPTTIARDAPVSFIGGTSGQISLINSHPAGSSVWMLGGTGHNYTDAYLYSHQEAFVINVSTLTGTAGLLADHCHIEGSRHAFYGQQAPTNGKPSWTFSRLSYSDSLSFVSEAIYGLADNVLHTGFFNHTINVGFQSATAKYFDDPSRIVYSGTVIGSEGTIKRWTNNQPASMTGIVVVFGGVPPQTLIYNATGEDDTLLNGMLSVSGAVQTGSSLSVSNGAVASVHVSFGGFYTNPDFPTVAIDPPASGVTALATVTGMSWFAAKDAIVAAGTGYVVGDVFTLVGGTHAVAASASVVSVNGTGGVTGVAIVNPGQYSAYPPAGATTTTGGSGTGLVMGGSIWGVIARDTIGVTVTVPGSGYTSFPNVAFSNPVSGDPQARGTVLMGTAWYADSTGAHGTFTGTIGSGSTGAFLPLTGGLISGHLNVNGTSTTWTSTATSGSTSSFISQGSHTSASHLSGGATINLFSVGTDTLQADNVNIMQIVANTSGAAQGTRQGLAVQLFQTSATATGGGWNALATIAEGRFSNGGTGLTATAALGSVFGFNPYARVLAGATNWAQCIGGEIDISVREPTGIFRKSGLQIVVDSADVGHGVGQDSGLTFATQTGGAGVRDLVELGNGLSQFPLYAAGDTSIMRVYTGQNALTYGMRANRGLDMLEADITSWQFRGRGFAVHGSNFVSGAVQIGNGVIQPIAGGIQISSPGNVGTGTPTVAAGGSGYLSNDILYDGYGGVYRATAAGGVTAVTVLRQPFVPGAAPSNPVATTTWAATNLGTGCTLNLSWTAGSAVQIGAVGNTTTFGGTHTAGNPCFHATLSATQSVTSGVATKCNFNVEAFDSDNAYDNATNYRFTPQKAGRYHVTASIAVGAGGTSGATFSASIYKNGVEYTRNQWSSPNTNSYSNTQITTAIVAMNGTTDYLEGWGVATGTTAPAFAGTISYMEANYIGA
jgi:hypothetical protein